MPERELKEVREELKEAKKEVAEARETLQETRAEIKAHAKSAAETRLELARQVEREVATRVITVMTTALAVVAGLFWQTALSDTIKNFIPISGAWQYELAIAFAITVLAGAAIYILSKSADGMAKKEGA